MLRRDSDLWPDFVLLVGEVEGESWRDAGGDTAEADAVEDIEDVVEVEPEREELIARGGDGCRLREERKGALELGWFRACSGQCVQCSSDERGTEVLTL
ncbi:uncharacterized protein CLUP02_11750 [Colletotrichum lupini]|uniref:Uncharacterized protein n=1 Tax=Colletotrichum lupini TaxID=145971 RepID=A0A9Q8SZJ8_9PEZI|nr:uncharacterized protein CLUP02_11750 [Colletotrichum lupini]UQC86250.1 hypothetical protein CLUP02_11750 [Colletotrichum lupini]